MIRAIAAMDDRLGVATDSGIPWTVPADVEHFRTLTASVDVLMGYGTYREFERPMTGRINYVATRKHGTLRDGFHAVGDTSTFLRQNHPQDLWIIGGAALFAQTLELTDELHLTRISGDFACTKFFPPFEDRFSLISDLATAAQGGTPAFRFQTWHRRNDPPAD